MSNSIHTNEHKLVALIRRGDTKAFNPLVRKYQPRLYRRILGRIKNEETAKDLTQETWLKAFRGINTFRGDAAFSSWIYRIAENVCIDFFRKQKIANSIEPLHTVDEHLITDTHPDPSERLQTQELRQILHKALEYLTQSRKEVFLLYYVQDLSIKTIAKRLKRSEGTVKTHLRNARLQLREHLTPYLENEDIPWLA